MKNNQKLGLKAFPSNKFKTDTEGSEHLLTMTNSYDISGHVTGRGAQKQANRPYLGGQFPSATSYIYMYVSVNQKLLLISLCSELLPFQNTHIFAQ